MVASQNGSTPTANKPKKCLVTGGAGFIGSHIVDGLLAKGHSVCVVDNLSTGTKNNLRHVAKKIDFIEGDIRDLNTLNKAADGVDVILHLAAMASVYQSIQEPWLNNDINVSGTMNVFEVARNQGVKKVIFASSAAVYGKDPTLPKQEDMTPSPVSPYGLSKLINEQYATMFADLYGIQMIGFRYFNVFGPRQRSDSQYSGVISIFTNTILDKGNPVVYGDGEQSRDFIHVSDIQQANLLAVENDTVDFGIFNVGSGQYYDLHQVLDIIKNHTGNDFTVEYRKDRRGDLRHSYADIEKITKILGFSPKKSFKQGLTEYIEAVKIEQSTPVSH